LDKFTEMSSNNILQIFIFGFIVLLLSPAVYGDESQSPLSIAETDTGPMAYPLKFFRNTISRADGHRCPMHPSCSEYSAQAFQKHGFIIGWIMTSDRLLRCGRDEKKLSENIIIGDQVRTFDPLHNNDFWWNNR